ncbi:MAG: hypothetical protein KDD64_15480 [Bdellovibrionales bacterium]|nr:hypothetical protein [Bdellovibrionales bacterium]
MEEKTEDQEVDGAAIAAEILNRMRPDAKQRIVSAIAEQAPAVAEKLESKLYRFEDILDLNAKSLQLLVASVNSHDLVLSLKVASHEIREALFGAVSTRRKKLIEGELRTLPPVKLSEVEAAERRILITMEELKSEGKLVDTTSTGVYA